MPENRCQCWGTSPAKSSPLLSHRHQLSPMFLGLMSPSARLACPCLPLPAALVQTHARSTQSIGHCSPECTATRLDASSRLPPCACHADKPQDAGCDPASWCVVRKRTVPLFLPGTICQSMGHLSPSCTAAQDDSALRMAPCACQAERPHPGAWPPL